MSQEQLAEILRLRSEGLSNRIIANHLGVHPKTVVHYLRLSSMTDVQRKKLRERINAKRRQNEATKQKPRVHVAEDGVGSAGASPSPRPPEWVIIDRDRRLCRPFDIRVDFLGEPEPGRSALDRKLAEQRV